VHFARTRSLPFKVALDLRGEVNRAFGGVKLTPTAFIVDKTGRIAERLVGEPDFARLNRSIERSLAAAD
jgi:peroxiredoxin